MFHVLSESISPSLPPNIIISLSLRAVQPKAASGSAPLISIGSQLSVDGLYFSAIMPDTVG